MDFLKLINEELSNLLESKVEDIYARYYSAIRYDDFDKIVRADPTTPIKGNQPDKLGRYSQWLLRLYANKKLKLEDLYKATDYLKVFDRYKQHEKIKIKDINHIKSLPDLYRNVQQVIVAIQQGQDLTRGETERSVKTNEVEKVYEDSKWLVVVPKTMRAACYYGKNTQWCTASNDVNRNQFEYYNKQGPLYINIDKINNKKYQFHLESGQFMDEEDDPIDDLLEFISHKEQKGLSEFYVELITKRNGASGIEIASDIKLRTDGNKFYLVATNGYEDFADLFEKDDRRTVNAILTHDTNWSYDSGDFDHENFMSYIDEENKARIIEIINHNATEDEQVDPNVDLSEVILPDEVESAIRYAASNAQESADESEAYETITSAIMSKFGVIRTDWVPYKKKGKDGNEEEHHYLNLEIQENIFKSLVLLAYIQRDEYSDDPLAIEYNEPYYGWRGEIDEEYFNDSLSHYLNEA